MKQIYKADGFRGLYRGFSPSLQGIIVYRAVFFGGYDTAKHAFLPPGSGVLYAWLVAQAVTAVAGIVAYPWDTVRRRLMMQSGKSEAQIIANGQVGVVIESFRAGCCTRQLLGDRPSFRAAFSPIFTQSTPTLRLSSSPQLPFKNSLHCWKHMLQHEGVKGFFKGGLTNTVRGSGAALVLIMYDEIQKLVGNATGAHVH